MSQLVNYVDEAKISDKQERERVKSVFDKLSKTNKRSFWIYKRFVNVLFSVFALIVFAIPMLIVALCIFIDDPKGSPIYAQTRIGRHGKPFKIYKFRTMVVDADKRLEELKDLNEMKDGPTFKIKDDPRITRLGKILRKTSIDELPQLFNVLKGDMVVVGPRPPLPNEVEQYTEYDKIRLIVTPGITCIWQVQPQRNDITFDKWVEMDIDYILHRNIFLDAKIIVKTFFVMFRGEGR